MKKTFLDLMGVLMFMFIVGLLITLFSNRHKQEEKLRPQGKAEYIYTAGGCNVYIISDGNGGNKAMLTRCPDSTTTKAKFKNGPKDEVVEVTNVNVEG